MKARRVGRLAGVIVTTVSIGVGDLLPLASSQPRQFGHTVAVITVSQDRLNRVRALYGPGTHTTITDVQSLCYYVQEDRSYLSVSTFERKSRVRSVVLTTIPNIAPGCRDATIKGNHLTAAAGIALGDPSAKIIAALGQPAETAKVPMGDHDLVVLDYPVAGGKATLQFEHDKAHSRRGRARLMPLRHQLFTKKRTKLTTM